MTDQVELFQQAVAAVHQGDVSALAEMLTSTPDLATMRSDDDGTLLIHLIDWPGHRPNSAQTARLLLQAGAEVDARRNENNGTPLAGVLCTEQSDVARVLLEFGADIHAPLGWMPGTVLGFADMLCENAIRDGQPAIQAFAEIFSEAAQRRVPKRAKMGSVTPLLFVKDADAAIKYYCEQLGFRVDWEDQDAVDDRYLCISRGGVEFHMTLCNCEDARHLGTLLARIAVEDVDRIAAEWDADVVEVRRPPKDEPWGLRECEIVDPDGNRIIFYGQHKGSEGGTDGDDGGTDGEADGTVLE